MRCRKRRGHFPAVFCLPLAGSASTNPIMFTLAVGVILAWRVAGYYGVDRWLLPMLGTPWRRGASTRPAASPMTT